MAKKNTEWKNQSVEELAEMAQDIDREIFSLRNELVMNRKLEKPHLLKAKRHEKARVLTLLTQKKTLTRTDGAK
jgi:ribosomal protein L29